MQLLSLVVGVMASLGRAVAGLLSLIHTEAGIANLLSWLMTLAGTGGGPSRQPS